MYSQVPAYPDATATEVECSNSDENRWVCVEASVREGTHTALFLVCEEIRRRVLNWATLNSNCVTAA